MQSSEYRREGLLRRLITGGLILGCAQPMIMFRREIRRSQDIRLAPDHPAQQRRIEGIWHISGDFPTHDRSRVVGMFSIQAT